MRIQVRLFVGTALLVLALMAVQWWLHLRQLQAMQRELAQVATTVGERLLTGEERHVLIRRLMPVTTVNHGSEHHHAADEPTNDVQMDVQMIIVADAGGAEGGAPPLETVPPCGNEAAVVMVNLEQAGGQRQVTRYHWKSSSIGGQPDKQPDEPPLPHLTALKARTSEELKQLHNIKFDVIDGAAPGERYLMVTGEGDFVERVPLPDSSPQVFTSYLRQGIGISAALLVVGLVASGLLSRQVARPLQQLADGAEVLGRGDLGVQVPVTASGEVGELQTAFNQMSLRLAELEQEREGWRRREHLVQLGDLARGLAHTVRNPLNTLGLTVEELASQRPDGERLVVTARSQIRRIDRWLRSFLALGAGDAAAPEQTDLVALTQAVALEAIQQGAEVRLDLPAGPMPVRVVPTALRAALANLLENAVQAAPAGTAVRVTVRGESGQASVELSDQGPGLPEEVRQRLFAPHVTTKVGGSGMGLFLARQLVVSMHGGTLQVEDGAEGGTVATVCLPLAAATANQESSHA